MNSDIDEGDFEEGALNHNYDIIGLKEESYPFRAQVIDRLNWYYNKQKVNIARKAEAALSSSNLFAVDIQIYLRNDPQDGIFVIADDVVLILFKK